MTNKEIVLKFYEEVFNNWDMSNVDDMMREDYKQHSPEVADGREGFKAFMKGFIALKPRVKIIKCIAQEDMVVVFFRCDLGGRIIKVFDMYRLEEGKLAEHWDSPMDITDMPIKNSNGHF